MRSGRTITIICLNSNDTPRIEINGKIVGITPGKVLQNISGKEIIAVQGRPTKAIRDFLDLALKAFYTSVREVKIAIVQWLCYLATVDSDRIAIKPEDKREMLRAKENGKLPG